MCLSYGGVGEFLLFRVLTLGPLGYIFYDVGGCVQGLCLLSNYGVLPNLLQSWAKIQNGGGGGGGE